MPSLPFAAAAAHCPQLPLLSRNRHRHHRHRRRRHRKFSLQRAVSYFRFNVFFKNNLISRKNNLISLPTLSTFSLSIFSCDIKQCHEIVVVIVVDEQDSYASICVFLSDRFVFTNNTECVSNDLSTQLRLHLLLLRLRASKQASRRRKNKKTHNSHNTMSAVSSTESKAVNAANTTAMNALFEDGDRDAMALTFVTAASEGCVVRVLQTIVAVLQTALFLCLARARSDVNVMRSMLKRDSDNYLLNFADYDRRTAMHLVSESDLPFFFRFLHSTQAIAIKRRQTEGSSKVRCTHILMAFRLSPLLVGVAACMRV